MRLTFRGWKREVMVHRHDVVPVKRESQISYTPLTNRKSMSWTEGTTAYGKVQNLALSGDFLIEFTFSEAELRNWLTRLFEVDPERANAIVNEVQAKAIRRLSRQTRPTENG